MTVHSLIHVILSLLMMTSLSDARTLTAAEDNADIVRKAVEVLVVVDPPAYQQWRDWLEGEGEGEEEDLDHRTGEAIVQFVKATFMGANLIWKGMAEHGLHLDLRVAAVRVEREAAILPARGPGQDRRVMNEDAFWAFQRWLIRQGLEFDHALLLTGLDLAANDSSGHEGYAYMDTMCGPLSVSVVENIINGIPAVVIAHEVGHSLSARHDGPPNNQCARRSGHIMNANNIGTSPAHWTFSACSARDIASKVRTLATSSDCLSEDSTRSPAVVSPYLGQLYSGDALCQQSKGGHSYVCRHLYGRPGGAAICTVLYCLVNRTYCAGLAPVDGLPCGAGKRCLAGECLPFDDVPEDVSDRCYTGDKPGFAWQNQTCGEVVASFTHLCQDRWYQDFCCSTCQSYYTGNDACPYGDAHDRCGRHYCGTRWEGECCDTCGGGGGGRRGL